MQNSLLVILFPLLIAWGGATTHAGWIADTGGDVDSDFVSLFKPENQHKSDSGHISSELKLVIVQVLSSCPDPEIPENVTHSDHHNYSIRAPPPFPYSLLIANSGTNTGHKP